MTPQTSENVARLIDGFLLHHKQRIEAVRRQDVPKANRHLLKAGESADMLRVSPGGRAAMERLLDHLDPNVQLSAGEEVMKWDPEKVVPLLGGLLDADLNHIESVDERLDIRHRARAWLFKHFNIWSADRNDLIEPLKAYGVNLRSREYTK